MVLDSAREKILPAKDRALVTTLPFDLVNTPTVSTIVEP